MATWKKVLVSGSAANLATVQVDNLTSGQVVIGGGTGNLSTTAINGTGNIVATTGATGVSISGSFSGSFYGDGSGLTGVVASNGFALTNGEGIAPFSYNGSAAQTVVVSGAVDLTNNVITKWDDVAGKFANTNITDDGALVNINSATNITGSLNVTGSQINLTADTFGVIQSNTLYLISADSSVGVGINRVDGNTVADFESTILYDSSAASSIDWTNRQLIKSDGSTVAVDWENGLFSGSFSGSFQGDGSQLTGIASTLSGSTDSGNFEVDLLTQYLTIQGTVNEIETAASGQTITIGLPNDVTIGNTLTVQGDLIVNGTTTVINTTNTAVEDQFILLASGSTSTVDAGIIVQNAANAGEAFYWENNPGSVGRWAIASNIAPTATTVTAAEYMVTAVTTAGAPAAAPTYGGATTGYGNIHVNSVNGDIYIYA